MKIPYKDTWSNGRESRYVVRPNRRNASLTLTSKGWAVSRHDQLYLTAPCKGCGVVVHVLRSGVWENSRRLHHCAVAA